MRKEIDRFLRNHNMHYGTIDLNEETERMAKAMADGLGGAPSSLMMIPAFITLEENLPAGEEVIVLDAGGTNLRVATVRMEESGKMTISNFQKNPMPGTKGALTADEFFERIADTIEPLLPLADKIGFCFSFPCDILPDKDGRIVDFCKEVEISGASGRVIGQSINAVLKARGYPEKQFAILNDTVATMLGGVAASQGVQFQNYIGYILGTGTNTCYLEDTAKITKSGEAMAIPGKMAINTESGCYDGFTRGTYDLEMDAASALPDDHQLEKMISGAYQGEVIYRTVCGAVGEGLFSEQFVQRLTGIEAFSMRDIDTFLADQEGDGVLAALVRGQSDDCEALYDIIDVSYERAARITAVTFASIARCAGLKAGESMCVMAEGTSFEKSVLYVEKLGGYLENYLEGELGVRCSIFRGEDVTLTGTAVAALMLAGGRKTAAVR